MSLFLVSQSWTASNFFVFHSHLLFCTLVHTNHMNSGFFSQPHLIFTIFVKKFIENNYEFIIKLSKHTFMEDEQDK